MSVLEPGFPHQDYIVLSGLKSPGKAVIKSPGSPRKWDIQDGYGFTGATVIFNGEGLAEFDVDVFLWDDDQMTAWGVFARTCLFAPRPGTSRSALALSIQHPILSSPPLTIFSVVVKNVTGWEQNDDGLWACTISFVQYRAPLPVLVKPLEPPPGSPIAVEVPIDPDLIKIQKKSAEITALSDP
jgi:hypothetical protein